MRITPLEIRQHTFDKSFRGYDTESVDAFLLSLSQEWERVSEEFRQSKQQLEVAEREIVRMKELEGSLFKTLKAAEDAQQNINANAEAEASVITDKARKEAEEITNEAQKKADMLVSESENKAKFLVEEAVNDLKNYERDFKAMERYKDYLVVELKSFANDALDKVTKFEERINTRTSEARLNELDIRVAEKMAEPVAPVVETPIEAIVTEPVKVEEVIAESVVNQEVESVLPLVEEIPVVAKVEEIEAEIDFNPANDYDDENEELPTVHAIVHAEPEVAVPTFVQPVPEIVTSTFTQPESEIIKTSFVHPVQAIETSTEAFNETADNLMKEMKATRGRPRKIVREDGGLPTVSSVMEEFTKEAPTAISNGGGSFFDNI
jgi:cell division initiation protein